jgi:hypothetical protein
MIDVEITRKMSENDIGFFFNVLLYMLADGKERHTVHGIVGERSYRELVYAKYIGYFFNFTVTAGFSGISATNTISEG